MKSHPFIWFCAFLAFLCRPPSVTAQTVPDWWPNKDDDGQPRPAHDSRIATVGQLKNMAFEAMNHLDHTLEPFSLPAGGAGAEIHALIASWRVDPSDSESDWRKGDVNRVINQGQLKAVAKPFYDRLAQLGLWPRGWKMFGSSEPDLPPNHSQIPYSQPTWWLPTPTAPLEWSHLPRYPWKFWLPNSYWIGLGKSNLRLQPANVGQLKFAFNFDLAERLSTLGFLSAGVPVDSDNDGVPDLVEILIGTDPSTADTSPQYFTAQQQTGLGANELSEETAARFLMQTTWGPTLETIAEVKSKGVSTWLNEQLNENHSLYGFRPNGSGMQTVQWLDGSTRPWQVLWYDWDGTASGSITPRFYPGTDGSFTAIDNRWSSVLNAPYERGPYAQSGMPDRGVEPYCAYLCWRWLVKDRPTWTALSQQGGSVQHHPWPYTNGPTVSQVNNNWEAAQRSNQLGLDDAWLRRALYDPDQLRHRVAWALSQILVVSDYQQFATEIGPGGASMAHYEDLLNYHAFRNFKDLLVDVTFHPLMAHWLTYINSAGASSTDDSFTHPDENYAREIIQLFSIGLNELNLDGTPRLLPNGQTQPTYTQEDVRQLARVFTGMQMRVGRNPVDCLPLKVNGSLHDVRSKTFLGLHLPAQTHTNNTAELEIRQAVEWIATRPSVAPFISRQLIQNLVTSNPTPGYVKRVSNVFANHASAPNQLALVVQAILTDSEARSADPALFSPTHGRLKDPMLRMISLMRAFHAGAEYGNGTYDLRQPDQIPLDGPIWTWSHYVDANTRNHPFWNFQQFPFISPTVFSFFAPGFSPSGNVFNARLLGPEFQILHAGTAVAGVGRLWNDTDHSADPTLGAAVPGFNSLFTNGGGAGGLYSLTWRQSLFQEATTLGTAVSHQGKALRLHFGTVSGHSTPSLPADPSSAHIDGFILQVNRLLCAGRLQPSTQAKLKAFLLNPGTTAFLNPNDPDRLARAAIQWLWACPEAAILR